MSPLAQVLCRDLFGAGMRMWNGGVSAHVAGALECVVQLDELKRFVDVWLRCAPDKLEQALKGFQEQLDRGVGVLSRSMQPTPRGRLLLDSLQQQAAG